MLYSSFRKANVAKTIIFVFLLIFWANTAEPANAAITADWGDVVDVHYFRYTNADYTGIAEDNNIEYIYLSEGSSVPPDVAALFPQASAGYFGGFKEGIVGLRVDESRKFSAVESGTTYYFEVTLLQIRYDAVVEGSTSEDDTETTTTTANKDPLGDLGTLVLFGGGGVIIAGGLLSWAVVSSRRRGKALSSESSSVSRRERSIKESKTKLKELRELAESRGSELKEEESTESKDIKFRRRR